MKPSHVYCARREGDVRENTQYGGRSKVGMRTIFHYTTQMLGIGVIYFISALSFDWFVVRYLDSDLTLVPQPKCKGLVAKIGLNRKA
jgi:hypothetical protein